MDLKRKLDNLELHLASISGHTDEDAAVRHFVLDKLIERIQVHKDRINTEVTARIEKTMAGAEDQA